MDEIDPTATLPDSLIEPINTVLGLIMGLAFVVCIAMLIVNFAQMSLARRNGGEAEPIKGLVYTSIGCFGIGSVTGIAMWIFNSWGG